MWEKLGKTDPNTRRLGAAELQKALSEHDVPEDSLVARDLYARAEVLRGYRGEWLVRAVDDDRSVLTPDAYLTRQQTEGHCAPVRSGPYRISKSDSELINASVTQIAAGEMVIE